MKKTIYDIAKDLKVAPSSVSKALNNSPGISDKLRKKILNYVKKVRFFPNTNASKLKTKKSFSIGIVYSEKLNIGLEHSFFSSILQYFKVFVENKGYEITFVISNLGNRKLTYLDFCQQQNIEGVFILTSIPDDPLLKELVDSDISSVSTDLYLDNVTTIISDNVEGAKLAVKCFYEKGIKDIVHIAGPKDSLAGKERLIGFKEQMQEYGLETNDRNIFYVDNFSFECGHDIGEKLIKENRIPNAIFTVSDMVAIGLIYALNEKGIKVPEDVKVIGFDDIPFAKYYCPSLSTIRQNTKLIGETAAEKLIKMMEVEETSNNEVIYIPVELVERNSSR